MKVSPIDCSCDQCQARKLLAEAVKLLEQKHEHVGIVECDICEFIGKVEDLK